MTTANGDGRIGRRGLHLLTLTGLILALCFSGCKKEEPAAQPLPPVDVASFTLHALQETADGIAVDTAFALTSTQSLTVAQVETLVNLTPHAEVKVAGADTSFTITPSAQLRSDTVYNLTFESAGQVRSFAFQTQDAFALSRHSPMYDYVPVDAGIELTFTGGRPADLHAAFSIEPRTEGRFEALHGNTFVFIPDRPLAYETAYTVTLSGALYSEGGEQLGEDTVFSFRTQTNYYATRIWISEPFAETFSPDRTPVVKLYSQGDAHLESYDIEVYQYPDQAGFLDAMRIRFENEFADLPVEGLPIVNAFSQRPQRFDSLAYEEYFLLPDRLPMGYYVVRMTGAAREGGLRAVHFKLLQVHDAAVYALSAEGSYVVWVNSTLSGRPVAGAGVFLNGYSRGMTDAGGVATVRTADIDETHFNTLTVDVGAMPFVVNLQPQAETEPVGLRAWMGALYTDREVYLPTDTIRVWGAVQPRVGSVGANEVTVTLDETAFTVRPDAFGAFEGTFELDSHSSTDYLWLNLRVDGEVVGEKYIRVLDYDKPIYTGSITTDKAVYLPGERAIIDGQVSFYDGTPAAGLALSVELMADWQRVSETPIIAEDGAFTLELPIRTDYNNWNPVSVFVRVQSTQAEDALFERNHMATAFLRDIMVEDKAAEDARSVRVTLSAIDFARAREHPQDADAYRGDAVDRPLTAEVWRHATRRVQTSTEYDPINKRSVPRYDYWTDAQLLETLDLETVQGEAVLPLDVYSEELDPHYYQITLHTSDRAGRPIRHTAYCFTSRDRYYYQSFYFSLELLNEDGTWWRDAQVGERVRLNLSFNGAAVDGTQGRALLVSVGGRGGVQTTSVHTPDALDLIFEQAHIPCAEVYAAWFDGERIYRTVSPQYLSFDPAVRKLNIALQTDKDSYEPGDTVTLDARVTDAQGQPVSAALCISVVDEAAFAIGPQDFNLLATLNRAVWGFGVNTYVSYLPHPGGEVGGGGGGNGGDRGARADFRDNPAFLTLHTKADGQATVSFKLAESLTSWRITALALSDGARGGVETRNVTTHIPFFVHALSADRYTVNDDVSVSLRGFGTALSPQSVVAFACELLSEGGSVVGQSRTGNGVRGEYVGFNFGRMPAGRYTLSVAGRSGELSDAVRQEIIVEESLLELPVVRFLELDQLHTVSPRRFPVSVMLYDKELHPWLELVCKLAAVTGSRADQQVAAAQAQQLLHKAGFSEAEPSEVLLKREYGGVTLLPYTAPDLLLTAKIAAAAPAYVEDMLEVFERTLRWSDSTAADVAAAYLGMAALKQPVLRDLRALVDSLGTPSEPFSFGTRERLLVVAALAVLGDQDGAKAAYARHIAPNLIQDGAEVYYSADDLGDRAELSGLALLTAARVAPSDAQAMARYLSDNPHNQVLTLLEQLVYAANNRPHGRQTQVTAVKEGSARQIDLIRGAAVTSLTKRELEGASFSSDEQVGMALRYIGGANELSDNAAPVAAVTRRVESVEGGRMEQSMLLRVVLTVEFGAHAPEGGYELGDLLPPGLRFVRYEEREYPRWQDVQDDWARPVWYPARQDGQRIALVGYYDKEQPNTARSQVVYFARAVLPGRFHFEPPLVTHVASGAWGAGEASAMIIFAS